MDPSLITQTKRSIFIFNQFSKSYFHAIFFFKHHIVIILHTQKVDQTLLACLDLLVFPELYKLGCPKEQGKQNNRAFYADKGLFFFLAFRYR